MSTLRKSELVVATANKKHGDWNQGARNHGDRGKQCTCGDGLLKMSREGARFAYPARLRELDVVGIDAVGIPNHVSLHGVL